MKPIEDIETVIKKKFHARADATLHDRVLARVRQAYQRTEHTTPAPCAPVERRTFMRSPMGRLGIAAAIIVAVGTGGIGFWLSGEPAAYAFTQTVEAMQGKRSFHIQTYFGQRRKDEFWAEFDEDGDLIRFRQEEDGGPKGPLITIWENGILNRYSPRQNLHQYSRLPNTEHGIEGLEAFDPETIVQETHALVEAGRAVMETDELARYAKLVTLRVTQENRKLRQVLVVDPVTKFVVRVDDYWGIGKEGMIHKGIEVLEYNEAMDPKLFVPDFPEHAILMDQVTQEVGLAQGDMTVKETAVEAARQALEAWAQEDYATAGKLFGGMPPQWFAGLDDIRPARILSIGEAESIDEEDRPPYLVRCQCEIERNGRTRTITLGLIVPDVDGQPGRWHVAIRLHDEGPADTEDLDLDGADLGLVQGQLSDEEVATAVVRRFWESFQAGDYEAVEKLVPPEAAVKVRRHFGVIKVLRIVSVGPAAVMPTHEDKAMVVPCTIEFEKDGQRDSIELKGLIVQHADRWILHDFID